MIQGDIVYVINFVQVCTVMKIIGFLVVLIIGIGCACDGGRAVKTAGEISAGDSPKGLAEIVFDTAVYDLGTIKEGEQVLAWL